MQLALQNKICLFPHLNGSTIRLRQEPQKKSIFMVSIHIHAAIRESDSILLQTHRRPKIDMKCITVNEEMAGIEK